MTNPWFPERDTKPAEKLTAELERFSFGIAVSPIAKVESVSGEDEYVATSVTLGDIKIEHSQHPATREQRVIVSGDGVPDNIVGVNFMFDTHASLLMAWIHGHAGPMPVPGHITDELTEVIKSLNDKFEAQS